MNGVRRVQFVLKVSKLCNLRCTYCYELADVTKRAAMPQASLREAYRRIAEHYERLGGPWEIEFIWHGGEPLLQSPDFYWETFDDQCAAFRSHFIRPTNIVQTNLTRLRPATIPLLREGFDGVGVSVDLFGEARVDAAHEDSVRDVLRNIDVLRANGIEPSCIAVLHRGNVDRVEDIFRFYESTALSFRLLPVFKSAGNPVSGGLGLEGDEVVAALKKLADMWFASSSPILAEPIYGYAEAIADWYRTGIRRYYDRRAQDCIYVVDVDGSVYGFADDYAPDRRYGNLFADDFSAIESSASRARSVELAMHRVQTAFAPCAHYGTLCTGAPVAEDVPAYGILSDGGEVVCFKDRALVGYVAQLVARSRYDDRSASPYEARTDSDRALAVPL